MTERYDDSDLWGNMNEEQVRRFFNNRNIRKASEDEIRELDPQMTKIVPLIEAQ